MSAFIVNYETINNILSTRLNNELLRDYCYLESEFKTILPIFDNKENQLYFIYEQLTQLGKEFLKLNCESVKYRYEDNNEDYSEYINNYKMEIIECSLAQSIKSLRCLMYQSCEIDNYKDNATYKKMEKLEKYLINAFLHTNEDYTNAKWAC